MPPPWAVAPLAWLALTVQPVSDSTLFSQLMPPPRAANRESTRLLVISVPLRVTLPPAGLRPPRLDVGRLLLAVRPATVSMPSLAMPPRAAAELFRMLLPVPVVVLRASLARPPPLPAAVLPLTVQLVRWVVPGNVK